MILAPTSITISRYGVATVTNGRPVYPAPSTVDITAGIAPASRDSLRRLPEGTRTDKAVDVYAEAALQTADEGGASRGDRFVYDGRTYEVQTGNAFPALAGQAAKWVYTAIVVAPLTHPEGS